ncbi:class I SAM-dependent methyltransferase [Actinocorallia sp. A-T 12471]|uniref:class I SAM-dependent methyltransferase n=1 Tax=Actinocorallia sp. A-T 12471 TaxID=3089813 RepID=UPI0029D0B6EC|nr:class I SAM-dependent methyltransferase [Actinocorallia sp. A-T 12471]MDX6742366.1 class I SAM-dependent methyltransferase [Actinocorallia sp. A-T 12471]
MNKSADAAPAALDRVLVTSRDYDEYLAMFALDDATAATARILDCPGGASDFGFRVRELGGRAVSVDPIYRLDPSALTLFVQEELDRGVRRARAVPGLYDFSWTGGLTEYVRRRERAAQRFLVDYALDRAHYVAAELPDLPFPDGAFDLALVPNLLFVYADLFGPDWHLRALGELVRVAGEVRVHPVTDVDGRPYPGLAALRAALAADGIGTDLVEVAYRLHPGTQRTLVCGGRGSR